MAHYFLEQVSDPSLKGTTVSTIFIIVLMVLGFLVYVATITNLLSFFRKPKLIDPVIAYKQVILQIDDMDVKNRKINVSFREVDDERSYKYTTYEHNDFFYFDMYKTIDRAYFYRPNGNAAIEVLGYGMIQEYSMGYTTTKQRVLQIILDRQLYSQYNMKEKFHSLVTTNWTDYDGNEIIFVPKAPYTYMQDSKKITIPKIKPTVLN